MVIAEDDAGAEDVRALLERHLDWTHTHSPPEDVHALDPEGLLDPAIVFFTAREGGTLLGTGALKLDGAQAEIKSMHTLDAARGRGVARAVLERLLVEARERGCERVNLETGSMTAFAPARRLYEAAGFTYTGPFGSYDESPYSTFMTRGLDGS